MTESNAPTTDAQPVQQYDPTKASSDQETMSADGLTTYGGENPDGSLYKGPGTDHPDAAPAAVEPPAPAAEAPKTVEVATPENAPAPAAQSVQLFPANSGPTPEAPAALKTEPHTAIPDTHVSRIDALLATIKKDAGIAEHWALDEIRALLHAA